jgi:fucose 4-O-acetylase-like acetyltransferase
VSGTRSRTQASADRKHAARDRSVDVAKGIAIVAIVVGHVNRGLAAGGLGADWSDELDRILYLVHLPVFAYLSGLFLQRGVDRDGVGSFILRRTALFLWLYVVWHVLQVLVKVATASLVNAPATWVDVVRLWIPQGQLWFLPWLIAVTVISAVWRPWSSRLRAIVLLALSSLLALATWGTDPLPAFSRGWALLLPFVAGAVIGSARHGRMFSGLRSGAVASIGIVLLLVLTLATTATAPTVDAPDRTWPSVAAGCVASFVGTLGVLGLAALLSRLRSRRVLTLLGERSLEIFLAHIIAGAGARIVLSLAGVHHTLLHLVVGTLVGLAAPMLLWAVSGRYGVAWLFVLPGWVSRTLAGRVETGPGTQNR